MKVLVCLISQQHIPNLLSVHHLHPDMLVLIATPFMKQKAQYFLEALSAGGVTFTQNQNAIITELPNEDSVRAMRNVLHEIYDTLTRQHDQIDWYINLTGGTKPMSIGAYMFFERLDANFLYINNSKPQHLLRLDQDEDGIPKNEIMNHRPTLREFVRGYGFTLETSDENIQAAREQANTWWQCARTFAEHEHSVVTMNNTRRNKARDKGITLNADEIVVQSPAAKEALHNTFNTGQKLNKHAMRFLTGDWLEVFFYGLLERHKETLNLWDTSLGLQVRGTSANEYDVCYLLNYSFCNIECKTGNQSQQDTIAALYKINATMKQFQALRVRSFLASTSEHMLSGEGIKEKFANRASALDITLISRHDIQHLARHHDSSEVVKKVLTVR